jgi:MFS-type transporter involved in bile tolerance (Atg22 family)
MFIHCGGYLIFGLGLILNKDLGIDSIYICGLCLTVPKLFGHSIMTFLASKFKLKSLNITLNAIVSVLALTLLVMNLIHNAKEPYSERSNLFRIFETGNINKLLEC